MGTPAPYRPIGPEDPTRPVAGPQRGFGMFKKGGKVPKTGMYKLHEGEHVIPKGKHKITNRKPQKMVSVKELMA